MMPSRSVILFLIFVAPGQATTKHKFTPRGAYARGTPKRNQLIISSRHCINKADKAKIKSDIEIEHKWVLKCLALEDQIKKNLLLQQEGPKRIQDVRDTETLQILYKMTEEEEAAKLEVVDTECSSAAEAEQWKTKWLNAAEAAKTAATAAKRAGVSKKAKAYTAKAGEYAKKAQVYAAKAELYAAAEAEEQATAALSAEGDAPAGQEESEEEEPLLLPRHKREVKPKIYNEPIMMHKVNEPLYAQGVPYVISIPSLALASLFALSQVSLAVLRIFRVASTMRLFSKAEALTKKKEPLLDVC